MVDHIAPDQLRAAMRHWATGVALVTVGNQEQGHGMTVNSFTSISLEPPLILVSMERTARTHHMAIENSRFAVAILKADQEELSEIFAGRTSDNENRFEDVDVEYTPSGVPVPQGSMAVLDCAIDRTMDAGTHTLFIALVEHAHISADGAPLLYFNRDYHRLSK